MKATACVKHCRPNGETKVAFEIHVGLSNGLEFFTSVEVDQNPSVVVVNNAIRSKVAAAAAEFGGSGLQGSDITIAGGVTL